jgi:hypothetical protein
MISTDLFINKKENKKRLNSLAGCYLFEGGDNNSETKQLDHSSSSKDSLADKYKDFKMPLKDEERVGRKIGKKGSQLIRSDRGSNSFKKSDFPKLSKFQKNEENSDSSSVDGSESEK